MRRSHEASIAAFLVLLLIFGYSAAARVTEGGVEERFRQAVGLDSGGEDTEAHRDLLVEVENFPLYIVLTLATLATGFTVYTFMRVGGRQRLG
ncbi:MAG: hypothetical protein QXT81_05600 [Candidatus Bathyarchaeia archaeon]